jgi:hypothetical protein
MPSKMIFGDVDDFAIVLGLNKNRSEFIRLGYSIAGVYIGSKLDANLLEIEYCLPQLLNYENKREHCALYNSNSREVFLALDANQMDRADLVPHIEIPEDFAKFNLWFHAALGENHIFAISCGSRIKILTGTIEPKFNLAIEMQKLQFDTAVRNAGDWIVSEVAKLKRRSAN